MSKSPADKIKEAAAGETDAKALSAAAETTGPDKGSADLNGDGKLTLTERVTHLEKLVEDLGKELIELKAEKAKASHKGGDDLAGRVANIERRLHGVVSE